MVVWAATNSLAVGADGHSRGNCNTVVFQSPPVTSINIGSARPVKGRDKRAKPALDRTTVLVTVMVICTQKGLRYFVVKFGRPNYFEAVEALLVLAGSLSSTGAEGFSALEFLGLPSPVAGYA